MQVILDEVHQMFDIEKVTELQNNENGDLDKNAKIIIDKINKFKYLFQFNNFKKILINYI